MTTTRAVLPLVAAIVGAALMVWGFVAGIDAALNGAGSNPPVFITLFFVGAILVVVALVLALFRLVKGGSKALSWAAIIVALLPMVAIVVLLVRARG